MATLPGAAKGATVPLNDGATTASLANVFVAMVEAVPGFPVGGEEERPWVRSRTAGVPLTAERATVLCAAMSVLRTCFACSFASW